MVGNFVGLLDNDRVIGENIGALVKPGALVGDVVGAFVGFFNKRDLVGGSPGGR
jgi:hypothetical protein